MDNITEICLVAFIFLLFLLILSLAIYYSSAFIKP